MLCVGMRDSDALRPLINKLKLRTQSILAIACHRRAVARGFYFAWRDALRPETRNLRYNFPMAKTRYKIGESDHPHFVTVTVVKWLPIFADPQVADIIINSLRYLRDEDNLRIYGYVVMENHLHLVGCAENLSGVMSRFKSYTARRIADLLSAQKRDGILREFSFAKRAFRGDREYQIWREGIHPQQIIGEKMLRQKLDYIHHNPVRRGYVDDPVHWRYSSARNYAEMKGLIEIDGIF